MHFDTPRATNNTQFTETLLKPPTTLGTQGRGATGNRGQQTKLQRKTALNLSQQLVHVVQPAIFMYYVTQRATHNTTSVQTLAKGFRPMARCSKANGKIFLSYDTSSKRAANNTRPKGVLYTGKQVHSIVAMERGALWQCIGVLQWVLLA